MVMSTVLSGNERESLGFTMRMVKHQVTTGNNECGDKKQRMYCIRTVMAAIVARRDPYSFILLCTYCDGSYCDEA